MADATAAGSKVTIICALYPDGFVVDEAADDVAFVAINSLEKAQVRAGLNGHKVGWEHATVYEVALAVIPNSTSDQRLEEVMAWSRIQQGNMSNIDSIQLVYTTRTGKKYVFADTTMTTGRIAPSTTTEGRYETQGYVFQGVTQVL